MSGIRVRDGKYAACGERREECTTERERERAPKNKPLMHAGGRGMRESGGGGIFKFRVRAMPVPD